MIFRSSCLKHSFSNYSYQASNIQFIPFVTQSNLNNSKHKLHQLFNISLNNLYSSKGQELFQKVSQEVEPTYHIIKNAIVTIDKGIQQFNQPIHWSFQKSGKQIRPILIKMLSNTFKKQQQILEIDRILKWGSLVQILHIASLVHDDIIDNSPSRRGRQTVQAKFGKTKAIFSGNYIIGKGYSGNNQAPNTLSILMTTDYIKYILK